MRMRMRQPFVLKTNLLDRPSSCRSPDIESHKRFALAGRPFLFTSNMALDLTELKAALTANHPVVLTAPPGTGKTTTIPPALLAEEWLEGRKIIVLEPRRLAARRAAMYIAKQRNERVGETVGWRVRHDVCVTDSTRIEFLTEGLLARKILDDPTLSDVGAIIFDEFHERALALDLAFALLKEVRESLRPDLRLLIMSATLQPDILPEATFLSIPAKAFPVAIRHCGALSPVAAVHKALAETMGSLLVFLPGEGEIRALADQLADTLPPHVRIAPLYAALPVAEQDAAVTPARPSERKIVLATSIAESSLTIEGIEVVIDTGLARVPHFSSRNGLTRLVTQRIPLDRMTQRTGRAGRTAPGICYRLWNAQEEYTFTKVSQPEILSADLTQTALLCAEWGEMTLNWLTPPPPSAWQYALKTLRTIGALEVESDRLTDLGRRLSRLPVHPALAAMMERMTTIDRAGGALLAAVCAEGERIPALRHLFDFRKVLETVLRDRPREIWQLATRWAGGTPLPRLSIDKLAPYLLWAFPGHLAKRRDNATGRYLLSAGFGAILPETSTFINEQWLFAVRMTDADAEAVMRWAFPIQEADLALLSTTTRTRIEWDKVAKRLIAAEETCLGEIVLKRKPLREIPPELAEEAERCRLKHLGLPWTKAATALMERIAFVRKALADDSFPHLDDDTLITALAAQPHRPLHEVIGHLLAEAGHSLYELDQLAPTHFRVPSGSNMQIHYDLDQPYVAVKIQEVFGLKQTPRLAREKVPLLLHLLSPAQRPVQVTSDLASFWANGYAIVRKDLRGRYPKHHWPEDPTQAVASRRTLKPKE